MADELTSTATRPYRKRRRAEQEAETRQRITEAAMRLHGTVGPAHTTISDVAAEAGVQRGTVYRHFPDADSLFLACSAHWASLNPPPDPSAWAQIADPDERLRQALAEMYRWYEWAEPMLVNVTRDAESVPALIRERTQQRREATVAALLHGRRSRGRARAREAAAIAHAHDFATWRSLVRQHGLEPDEVVELMAALVAAAPSVTDALR
jgi:AcrR family transcriptional regulator